MRLRLRRRQKYGATRVTLDGLTFDSKREASRYLQLKLRARAGEIAQLEVTTGHQVVEDAKSPATHNGVEVQEV